LIALRGSEPALTGRDYTMVHVSDDSFAYARGRGNRRRILVALNFSTRRRSCQLPEACGGVVLLSRQLDRTDEIASNPISLEANEA
jgi:hypothetical protein